MRLDKYLCDMKIGSRSEVKLLIKKGLISVDGVIVKSPEQKIDETRNKVCCRDKPVSYVKFQYFMLNKPAGVVSATEDRKEMTVLDLVAKEDRLTELFPVGRLDKDTTGLLILTNNGELSHRLLSPRHHVDKTYLVEPQNPLSTEDLRQLAEGVDIGDDTLTRPAKAVLDENGNLILTIHEGRFHQVKRMLVAVSNEVVHLKRLSFGGLDLDSSLAEGTYRPLTESEVETLTHA